MERLQATDWFAADVLCPVVVGRESELRTLEDSLSNAVGGQGGCLFVTGQPGIGKSRLVREICRSADSRGAMAMVGRAVLAGASVPFRPLTEALLQALRARPPLDRVLSPVASIDFSCVPVAVIRLCILVDIAAVRTQQTRPGRSGACSSIFTLRDFGTESPCSAAYAEPGSKYPGQTGTWTPGG